MSTPVRMLVPMQWQGQMWPCCARRHTCLPCARGGIQQTAVILHTGDELRVRRRRRGAQQAGWGEHCGWQRNRQLVRASPEPGDASEAEQPGRRFDAEATLQADIQRMRAEKAEDIASGLATPSSSNRGAGLQDTLNTGLVTVFFAVLVFGAWLAAGVAEKSFAGTTVLSDAWFTLWPVVIQPLIGILMAASLLSGVTSWAQENGYTGRDK